MPKLSETLGDFVDRTAWHGLPRVRSSRHLAVKVLWACLLLVVAGIFGFQFMSLFQEYYSYPIKTSVNLKHHPIQYPAITFCNMNPVKRSAMDDVNSLKDAISPPKPKSSSTRKERSAETEPSDDTFSTSGSGSGSDWDSEESFNTRKERSAENEPSDDTFNTSGSGSGSDWNSTMSFNTRKERSTGNDSSDMFGFVSVSGFVSGSVNGSGSWSGFGSGSGSGSFYDYWANFFDYSSSSWSPSDYDWGSGSGAASALFDEIFDDGNSSVWSDEEGSGFFDFIIEQFYSAKDQWFERKARFQSGIRNESYETRERIGHSLEDMVLSASYSGVLQNISTFSLIPTSTYGNCYTMESSKYRAWKSGPSTGIKLTFNLEIDEYLQNYASGYGMRMVFHTPGTLPLPEEEGITLSPGYETSIGLRMVQVERLGEPYGQCSDGVEFKSKYKLEYSITSCRQFCRVENIIASCDCIPGDGPDSSFLLSTARVCERTLIDRLCVLSVDGELDDGTRECDCISQCSNTMYEKTLSGSVWPNDEYLSNVLMHELCRNNTPGSMKNSCMVHDDNFSQFDHERYRNNFLQVQIYFEDLNFESIVQEPLYEFPRFLSDIGGAMGLFLGGSLLSFAEILELILELVLYIIWRVTGSKEEKKGNKVEDNSGPAVDGATTDTYGMYGETKSQLTIFEQE